MIFDLSTKSLAKDLLLLASVYQSGLRKTWQNQTEAAGALARLKVTRAHINRAVRLNAMPRAVLSLFSSTKVRDATARELIRLENKFGRDEVQRRAERIDANGRSWQELVAMLEGVPPPVRRRAEWKDVSPIERASQFADGLASNLWSTMAEAATITGWDRSTLARAIAISKLPSIVLSLFDGSYMSLEVGETLIGIQRTVGEERLIRNARALHDRPKRRSTDELLNALAGARDYSDMSLRIRATPTKISFEMTFNVEDARGLLIDEDEVKGYIQAFLMSSRREKRKK
jgi:hypothetical protein